MYTPGPWKIKKADSFHETPYIIGDGHDGCAKVCRLTDPYPYGKVDANAALIAAAPDLLAALEECADYIASAHTNYNPFVIQARAAIAKATS